MEKFDPTNEPFDPHRHNAVFQVPDNSKPPGTVAHVLKVFIQIDQLFFNQQCKCSIHYGLVVCRLRKKRSFKSTKIYYLF